MVNMLRTFEHQEMIESTKAGEEKKIHGSSFYRGENCNFGPYHQDQNNIDFAQNFFLKGWTPATPFIENKTKVTAFGSCFAENISKHLMNIGFDTSKQREKNIYISSMGDGLVNVHAISQQFKWALDGWTPPTNLWHGYKAEEYELSDEIRIKTQKVFLETDVFILTLGLSEIWYDQVTGGVFWRAVPMKNFDSTRHKFRICSYKETKNCIEEIIEIVSRHVPSAKIIMTVSPIPLITTFRPVSCMTANSVSKALLRSALDETLGDLNENARQNVFYFPAFELINECFPNRFYDDGRHLQEMIVPSIMQLFEASFCKTNLTIDEAERNFQKARLENVGTLTKHLFYQKGFNAS